MAVAKIMVARCNLGDNFLPVWFVGMVGLIWLALLKLLISERLLATMKTGMLSIIIIESSGSQSWVRIILL